MNKEQNASNITVIPDGNGDLLKAWECWWTKQTGFGKRSWRYLYAGERWRGRKDVYRTRRAR